MKLRDSFKKTLLFGLISAMLCSLLGGCGLFASTGLNDNDEELVAEYAAGVLMRYSADKKGGFGNPKPTPKPTEAPQELPEPEPERDNEPDAEELNDTPKENEAGSDVSEVSDNTAVKGPVPALNGAALCDAIGINGFDISYEGYEIADIYPKSDGKDLTFSMQAAPGKKLIILHLDVLNPDSAEKVCSVLDQSVKFRILVNGTERINEQMTILLNDLKSYNETIGAGEKNDTVLVFEADAPVTGNINSLSLIVVGTAGESVFELE